jgi:hypothetical protein
MSLSNPWSFFLACHKILRHGAGGFTSTPNEGVMRIDSAGFDPADLGSIDKDAKEATKLIKI